MKSLHDHIDNARKMVSAARGDSGKHKEEILDGVEGHLDRLERDLKNHDSQKWVVVADANTGFAELANVAVVVADTAEEAKEKMSDNPQHFGKITVKKLGDVPERGDTWCYFR